MLLSWVIKAIVLSMALICIMPMRAIDKYSSNCLWIVRLWFEVWLGNADLGRL